MITCTLAELPLALRAASIANPAIILVSWPKAAAQDHQADVAA
jgi:hypothetical protein